MILKSGCVQLYKIYELIHVNAQVVLCKNWLNVELTFYQNFIFMVKISMNASWIRHVTTTAWTLQAVTTARAEKGTKCTGLHIVQVRFRIPTLSLIFAKCLFLEYLRVSQCDAYFWMETVAIVTIHCKCLQVISVEFWTMITRSIIIPWWTA